MDNEQPPLPQLADSVSVDVADGAIVTVALAPNTPMPSVTLVRDEVRKFLDERNIDALVIITSSFQRESIVQVARMRERPPVEYVGERTKQVLPTAAQRRGSDA